MTTAFQSGAFQDDAFQIDAAVGGVVCDLSVTDTSDTLAADALVSIAIDLSVTDTGDSLVSAVLVEVVADASNTDTADALDSTALIEVLADLSATDADDTLSSDVSIPVAGGVVCTLDVTDEADSLAADCTITGDAVEDAVSLGGRDKLRLQDVPYRRVKADLSVTDDSDQLYAAAKVSQLMKRIANLAVIDSDDTMDSSANAYWVQPTLIRNRQVKLVSSRYEAVTL